MMHSFADDDLAARCLDGRATVSDIRLLEARLEADPEFRIAWLALAAVDEALREMAEPREDGDRLLPESHEAAPGGQPPEHGGSRRSGSSRPVAHVLIGFAGVVLGMVVASVAGAFVTPGGPLVNRILIEDFERTAAPAIDGPPVAAGSWGGDVSELVGAQNGVTPSSGGRMLRFVRDHYVGKSKDEAWSCDVHRLIDLRPHRQHIGAGGAVVRITAKFNAAVPDLDVHERFRISAFAIDAETATNGCLRNPLNLHNKSLAFASSQVLRLDGDPRSWQSASAELRVPTGVDFILVHVGVYKDPPELTAPTPFGGHYCDDVAVVFVEQAGGP